MPLNENSAVLGLTELMTTLEPLAVTLPFLVVLWPTITLPKSMLPGFTDNCPGALADPDNATDNVGFEASEVSVRFPLVVPLTAGVNVMLKVTLCPAASVVGSATPLSLKAEEETAADEMATLALPLLVTLWYCEALPPSTTVPNDTLVGFAANCPLNTWPVPESATDNVGFEAFEVSVRVPLVVPLVPGTNVKLKFRLCPAASVAGNETPLTLNAEDETAAAEMVTLTLPLLVTL